MPDETGAPDTADLRRVLREIQRRGAIGRLDLGEAIAHADRYVDAMPDQVDLVTALHACDTATDDAIAFGLQKKARAMVLVPCCQAEVARALNAGKALNLARTPLAELWRHPLHTREIGSQITNVLRCLYLEASGYKVTVTELVGWEHSLKNELIILEQFGLQELLETRFKLA